MGGHGALTIALKNPGRYKVNLTSSLRQAEIHSYFFGSVFDMQAVSAFAPIGHPTIAPWGTKAFTTYLGSVDAGNVRR